MKRQAEIAPLQRSFVLSTQFPCPIGSGKRVSMSPPPRQSSLPPLPPMVPTTSTQLDQTVFSLPPMSPAPSPLSFTSPPNSAYSDHISAGLDAMEMIYPKPIEMPVGPAGEKESHDEYVTANMDLDKIFDFPIKDDDVERFSTGNSKNWKNSIGSENWRNSTLRIKKDFFTASQVKQIARCEKLRKLVFTDPKYVKRILSNREAAKHTTEKRAQRISELEKTVHNLEKEAAIITSHTISAEIINLGLEEENMQIRIRLQEMEEQAKRANALREYYNGEINRLKEKGRREVRERMDEIMLMEQLKLYEEEPQPNYYGFE